MDNRVFASDGPVMAELIGGFDLQRCNTLGLAARARWLAPITAHADLQDALSDARAADLPRLVLGGGSNLVLAEEVDALVLHNQLRGRRLLREDADAWYVSAAGGEPWHEFVLWTLEQGWHGLENLALIPGTVGAAPVQNVGAYGVEIKDVLFEARAWSLADASERVFALSECAFAYRDSVFKQAEAGRWLIAEVVFRLPKNAPLRTSYGDIERELTEQNLPRSAQGVAQAVINVRSRKLPDPRVIGNAGSFFKNPLVPQAQRDALLQDHPQLVSYPAGEGQAKLAAGWLIEQCGWKGRQLGPVGMYQRQALVLVNHGGATAADVAALMASVQADVHARFGVSIEAEPVWWR